MAWIKKVQRPGKYVLGCLKWAALGVLMGGIGGLLGALFHHALHFVTHLRQENQWLVWLLPVGGVLTVMLYKLLRLEKNRGTNEIIDAALDGHRIPFTFSCPAALPICLAAQRAGRVLHCSLAARRHPRWGGCCGWASATGR